MLQSDLGQEPCDAADDPAVEADFAVPAARPASPHVGRAARAVLGRRVGGRPRRPGPSQCGLYTVTPDHRPLIDETPVAGLYVNTGYSGHGVMCSVAGGRLLVERIHATTNPFALDRTFELPTAQDAMIGAFVQTPKRAIAQVLAVSGIDLLVADGEHAPLSPADIEEIVVGGDLAGVPVLARVPFSPAAVQHALDSGAAGVLVPLVESAEAAAAAVAAARFPHAAGVAAGRGAPPLRARPRACAGARSHGRHPDRDRRRA